MRRAHYYLMTSLPRMGELGSEPPIEAREFLSRVAQSQGPLEVVEVLLLGDDLLLREASLAGEPAQAEPTVLSQAQVRNAEPLPDTLAGGDEQTSTQLAIDRTWEAYFRHAADVATRRGSAFLARWVAWEVALRNALAEHRARSLELDPQPYLVATDLAEADASLDEFDELVMEWSAAASPLAGLRVLDQARWAWIARHDAWFSFGDDEPAAYTQRMILLWRWHRLTAQEPVAAQ